MLAGDRSEIRFVQAELHVKVWIASPPTVDEVRPGRCPVCGAAGRPLGGQLGLHGHGLRERHQWGPAELGAVPAVIALLLRRYQCQPCGAVVVVGPRGLLRRRLYSAGAVAVALALYGLAALPPAEVRRRVSPLQVVGATAAAGWASLRRWCRAVRAGRIFLEVRALPPEATLREVAARAATTLAAYGPGGVPLESAAFLGASM